MKPLICELCTSNDIVKQDGFFVCQHCGTKYTIEEAKKLMLEGTVKIDNSDKLKNYYTLARQAAESNDDENAVKYYDLIKQEDPNSWEACFYNVYFRATQTKILYIESAANSINNCLDTVFNLIKNGTDSDDEKKKHVLEVALRVTLICKLFESSARSTLNKSWTTKYNSASYAVDYSERTLAAADALFKCGDLIERDYNTNDEMIESACELWKSGVNLWKTAYAIYDNHANRYSIMKNSYVAKIKKYQNNYEFSAPQYSGFPNQYAYTIGKHSNSDFRGSYSSTSNSGSTNGGCYVATAVYGSYDCPEVWTLRRFRDNVLAKSFLGRLFIYLYYAVSPTLVKWFGETEWFKNMWKPILDEKVKQLNHNGVANTPYNDKQW